MVMHDATKQVVALAAMVAAVVAVVAIGGVDTHAQGSSASVPWEQVETGDDHIGPIELAHELLRARSEIALVDVRPREEFERFHLPSAISMTVPELVGDRGAAVFAGTPRLVVVYSNGAAHPAQAWVELQRQGYGNVRVLDGGLDAFVQQVLTPPSLRSDLDAATAEAQRGFFAVCKSAFLASSDAGPVSTWASDPRELAAPCVVSPAWLAQHLPTVAVLDVRARSAYDAAHVKSSVHVPLSSLRSRHGDRDLMLLPAEALAATFGSLGIAIDTPVAIVADDRVQDAALAALALLRTGHTAVAIVEGGVLRWAAEGLPLDDEPVTPTKVVHGVGVGADDFTIGIDEVARLVQQDKAAVVDVRVAEQFRGTVGGDARRGHIPGARNRPLDRDVVGGAFAPREVVNKGYEALGIDGTRPTIVTCRTGHQAAATFFLLRYLRGQ
ncbi:MAG: rhodanese-like domain-containing protein, partial [Planctomycetota bacterium]